MIVSITSREKNKKKVVDCIAAKCYAMHMAKKKASKSSVRLDTDCENLLKEIAESDPLRPSLSQLVNKLVRMHGYTLKPDQRPG